MNFKQLIRLYESEIVFQYPGEDEEKNRDKIYSLQKFETWFNLNKMFLNGINRFKDMILIALKGCPWKVKKSFNCSNNQLISLESCPKKVEGDFDCSHNSLISLEGYPKEVEESFLCYYK